MSKIKKCPHCGSKISPKFISEEENAYMSIQDDNYDYSREDNNGWYIICRATKDGCGSMSGWGQTKEAALAIWNKRKGK